jgi:hypothetical protein
LKKYIDIISLSCLVAISLNTNAQVKEGPYPLKEDVSSIEGMMKAYYEVVSGPAGAPRQIERDRSLHHPDALIIITGKDENQQPYSRTMSFDEFHANTSAYENGFWEYEIERKVQGFGNIAHVWSTYAWSQTKDGMVGGRGINSIQLYHDGKRWWLLSWMYDSERPDNPIPALANQASSIPDWFLEDLRNHIGVWKTDNSSYKSKDESMDAYGIEWGWGVDQKSITGHLYGFKDGTKTADFWQFRYYWDPGEGKAIIVQYGYGGGLGKGFVQPRGKGESESIQTFFTPGQAARKVKHIETISGDTQTSTSFRLGENEEWIKDRHYIWHRVQ